MSRPVKVLVGVLFSVLAGVPVCGAAHADPIRGSCSGGELRWDVVDGSISMVPRQVTFVTSGVWKDCVGIDGITGATVAGVHKSMSSCVQPADGPLTFTIDWSNGATSTVWGDWPVGMVQPTVGELTVVDGLGAGGRVRIVANYNVWAPETVIGCLTGGISSGTGMVQSITFL